MTDGNFELFGGAGNDLLVGGRGGFRERPARIEGGGGNDTIKGVGTFYGGAGRDVIEGNGTFYGGGGNDTLIATPEPGVMQTQQVGASLWGGAGRDTFVFVVDTDVIAQMGYSMFIRDFEPGEIIDLRQTPFESLDDFRIVRSLTANGAASTIFIGQYETRSEFDAGEFYLSVCHVRDFEIGAESFLF